MKVIVAGDFCPQERVAQLFEKGDFSTVLGGVQPILSKADYSIVNFECPVTRGAGERPIVKHGPNLHCSRKGVEALKWAGFDCVTLANNHFLDYGGEGVGNTIDACAELKISTVGGGRNITEASQVLYENIGEKILAIINCCEHEFSIATAETGGANPLNPIQQYYAIKEAKSKADYVLVVVHGGHEHFQLPSPRMVETYRFFIDAGADAVVNHHQHCFSGYEVYNEKPIFYGLGNFCFDRPSNRSGFWTEGYMVELELNEDKCSFILHPYLQCADKPSVVMLPSDAYRARIDELNSVISDSQALDAAIEEYYNHATAQLGFIYEPIYSKYYNAARIKGVIPSMVGKKKILAALNYTACESHRDKLLFWLNKHK